MTSSGLYQPEPMDNRVEIHSPKYSLEFNQTYVKSLSSPKETLEMIYENVPFKAEKIKANLNKENTQERGVN